MHQVRVGALHTGHRSELVELLTATNAFSSEEVGVALGLFDEAFGCVKVPPDYEFIGAFGRDETLVGYACFGPTPATEGTYDLYWIAVHPAAQGNGVGQSLVEEIEFRLKARAVRILAVETSSRGDYARTRKFYERCGYAEAARIRDFYAPADDRIILTNRLTSRERGVATR